MGGKYAFLGRRERVDRFGNVLFNFGRCGLHTNGRSGMGIGRSRCTTVKQRNLSILMPLRQSVCRPYLQRLRERIKQHVPKSIRSYSSLKRILLARQCKSSNQLNTHFLLIQPLDFIFFKILPVLNIVMTLDFLFSPKAALLSIYLLLKPLSSKLLTRSLWTKNSCKA